MAAAFVVVVAGIKAAEFIINPLLLSVFLAIISAPAYFGLVRRGVSTWLSLLIVIGGLSVVFLGVVLVLMESIAGFTSRQAYYADRITDETEKVQQQVQQLLPDWLLPDWLMDDDAEEISTTEESEAAAEPSENNDELTQRIADSSDSEDGPDDEASTALPVARGNDPPENDPASVAAPSTSESTDTAAANADDSPAGTLVETDGSLATPSTIDDADSDSTPTDESAASASEVAEADGTSDGGDPSPLDPADLENDSVTMTEYAPAPIPFTDSPEPLPQSERSWQDYMTEQFKPRAIFTLAAGIVRSIGQILSKAFLILLTVIFILLEAGSLDQKVKEAFAQQTPDAGRRAREIIDSIHRYIVIKSWVSLATGLLIALWLKVLGVPYANLWGLLAFLFNFVPNVGSIIAAIPAVLIAWLDLSLWPAIFCAAGFLVVNVVIGNFVEPRVMGRGLGLSPLVVFCSMVFWGWVLGPVGMLLSVPLTMTARIALDGFEDTKWVATLMGNVG
jgi:predicted PurR-regulated permease PerM